MRGLIEALRRVFAGDPGRGGRREGGDDRHDAGRSASARERELDEEIRTHLELRTEELMQRGMDREQARAEAERRFGELETARPRLEVSARRRDRWLRCRRLLDSLRADVALALRRARQGPGFTLLVVATFALGVGLTTATWTVVDRVLLRPMPYPEPDELVALYSMSESRTAFPQVSQGNWLDWKERSDTLELTALHSTSPEPTTVSLGGEALNVPAVRVSGPFFELLGNPLLVGRGFTEEEAQSEAPLAVVSEGFWRRALGADPALDRRFRVRGAEYQVVGVVADGRAYPSGTDLWLPYRHRRQTGGLRNNINWHAIARLHAGVSIEEARANLDSVAEAIRTSDPAALYSWGVGVVPLREHAVGDQRDTLLLLMAAVVAVLLVACANLAGLGYARSDARRRDTAVRMALGAGPARLVRQHVTEQVLLALAGGGLGILAAWATIALFTGAGELPLPRADELGVDPWVFAFGVGVSVLAGLLAGVAPALRASSSAPRTALASSRGEVRGGRGLPGAALVGAEVALAVVLLVGGGLLVRSFTTLVGRDLGFRAEGVLTADISLSTPRYLDGSSSRRIPYWNRAMEAVGGVPGVEAVAVANPAPAGGGRTGFVEVEGRPELDAGAGYRVVSEDYFRLLEIPLVAGRTFVPADAAGGDRVTVVNRALAEAWWPDQSAIGHRIRATSMEAPMGIPWLTVIGVVENVRNFGFRENQARPAMYVLYRQAPYWGGAMTLLARVESSGVAGVVRERLRSLDPGLAVEMSTLPARLGDTVSSERLTMSVLGTFAVLALGLASIGLFGLLSFAVVQRRAEIAVRATLGATRAGIVGLVLRNAAGVVGAGMALGLLAAWWLADLMAGLLVGVVPRDPVTFVTVAAVLAAVATTAALVPAWRAARLDPVETLRRG